MVPVEDILLLAITPVVICGLLYAMYRLCMRHTDASRRLEMMQLPSKVFGVEV